MQPRHHSRIQRHLNVKRLKPVFRRLRVARATGAVWATATFARLASRLRRRYLLPAQRASLIFWDAEPA